MSRKLLLGMLLPALLSSGCASMSNGEKGALGGGAIGAGTGALIGNSVGHTGGGALIGTAIGAMTGGLIGHSVDKSERQTQAAVAAANARALQLPDVAQMSQQHISDDVIIGQIRSTGTTYCLQPADIYWLKQNGVSDVVVREMQATACRYPRRVYVEPPPPPPVSVGLGYTYVR